MPDPSSSAEGADITRRGIDGGCLCGAVRYRLHGPVALGAYCHCRQCRKMTGSGHATNLYAEPEAVQFVHGGEHVRRYEVEGRDFTRAFCPLCGSGLPYLNQSRTIFVVPAGTLDAEPEVTTMAHAFVDERPAWSRRAEDAPRHAAFPPEFGDSGA